MSQPKQPEDACTSRDYWNLPEGVRAELIDGKLYDMAPPSWVHQVIVTGLSRAIGNHIEKNGGRCRVVVSPVAVNLTADDKTWVEPDVVVVCDPAKISDRGVEGAPDMVVEVVSPASISMDYYTKAARYQHAGVREYWIVDPSSERTTVYRYQGEGPVLSVYLFSQPAPVSLFEGLSITVAELL